MTLTTRIIVGDALEELRRLPDDAVDCVVTSPPYWGLRDYGTGEWIGGDPACPHKRSNLRPDHSRGDLLGTRGVQEASAASGTPMRDVCLLCGAARSDRQMGLEASPWAYIEGMREVFAEVRRVLKPKGTLWLNMGDCFVTVPHGPRGQNAPDRIGGDRGRAARGQERSNGEPYMGKHAYIGRRRGPRGEHVGELNEYADVSRSNGGCANRKPIPGLKHKDLVGMPWRLAFALQDDGWWLRSDIIWAKPNPMPESIKDRPTRAHEYLFLLSKRARYYYNQDAIREPHEGRHDSADLVPRGWQLGPGNHRAKTGRYRTGRESRENVDRVPRPRKKSSGQKWAEEFLELPKRRGLDPKHGGTEPHSGPTRRERRKTADDPQPADGRELWGGPRRQAPQPDAQEAFHPLGRNKRSWWEIATQPFPGAHFATFPEALVRPCVRAGCPLGGTVLDPFAGSGTVGVVALREGMSFVGIELNPEYAGLARRRLGNETPALLLKE